MAKGVCASAFASILFAVMFYYVSLLAPLTGEEVFGWRMLFNAPCITALLVAGRNWQLVRATIGRFLERPALMVGVLVTTGLIATQFWLFVWAPINGHALDASLGFFLMPLVLVLLGRVLFRERMSRPQLAAALLAIAGVGNELIQVGGFSWVTMVVAVGYPTYFVLRRLLRIDHQGGVWIEMQLMLPVAVFFILTGPSGLGVLAEQTDLLYLIPGLGLISAVALTLHYLSSQLLNFALFGLLIYLEPVLLVVVAMLLGEVIEPGQWLTYIPIWAAVGVLFGEGVYRVTIRRRRASSPTAVRRET